MFKNLFNPKTEKIMTKWESGKNKYSRVEIKKGFFNKTVHTLIIPKQS